MLQLRKQFIFALLISAMLLINVISATNRSKRNANDADYLTIILDETMRNLLKQCNKSAIAEDYKRCVVERSDFRFVFFFNSKVKVVYFSQTL